MDESPARRSVKLSTPVHSAVHRLATELGKSADAAVQMLLDPSTVRLPLSTTQHERWTSYADAAGVSLAEWITLRVEAAIQYGSDPGTMHLVLDHVRALALHAEIQVRRTPARKTPPKG